MTDPAPIPWALDVLAAHGIPALGEDEDPHRLIGELVSLGWDVSWAPVKPKGRPETKYEQCVRVARDEAAAGGQYHGHGCKEWYWSAEDEVEHWQVTGKAKWLPVGEVRFVVTGETFAEAVTLGLAMALDLQGNR